MSCAGRFRRPGERATLGAALTTGTRWIAPAALNSQLAPTAQKTMTLGAWTQLGPYEILPPLGAALNPVGPQKLPSPSGLEVMTVTLTFRRAERQRPAWPLRKSEFRSNSWPPMESLGLRKPETARDPPGNEEYSG